MNRYILNSLLITCLLVTFSCHTAYISTRAEGTNLEVSEAFNLVDSAVVAVYLPFKKVLEKDMSRIISVSSIEMVKDKPESELTNFLADLLLEEGRAEAASSGLGIIPQVSYFNYGGIRTYLPEGEITVGKIFELMPFENEMVFVELDGSQMKLFFDAIAAKGGDSVGGATFLISDGKAKNIKINGMDFDVNGNYWMVTNDYITNGGDGMEMFSQRKKIIGTGKKIRDVIIGYMEKKQSNGEPLAARKDGRIRNE